MSDVAPQAQRSAPRIETAVQIPRYMDNLCRPDGAMPMRADDAKIVAMLDVGEKRVIALWAGETSEREVLTAAAVRVKQLGYKVVETREASRDMVALCLENRQQEQIEEEIEDTAATRMFDQILGEAVQRKASDLHLQLMRNHARMIARINGELVVLRTISTKLAETLARAMYSQADIDSRLNKPGFNPRTYQDASISRSIVVGTEIHELKLRWASGPVWPDAFDVALRILNVGGDGDVKTLAELGFDQPQQDALNDALKQPSGMIMLCGTTGAGKSTTLATLAEMWAQRYEGLRMLRSIEDPPEYVLRHGRQMPVSRNERAGNKEEGFHVALRAAMRMDPDALLLGEIRDPATADLAQQAVDTGHKVFTTLHAGSVFDALWRVTRLGLPRDRLASEGFINAIVHQVLVPLLCQHCSQPLGSAGLSADDLSEVDAELTAEDQAAARVRGPGCGYCENGIASRVALASMLLPDTRLRELIREGHEAEAKAYWRSGKCRWHGGTQARTIVDQARELIAAGRLSPLDAIKHIGRLHDEFDAGTGVPK